MKEEQDWHCLYLPSLDVWTLEFGATVSFVDWLLISVDNDVAVHGS